MKKHSINDPWEALVLSILSVNGYPIEKTYSISDNLRKNGFFNPNKLAHYDFIDITRRIDSAGYKRGPFMTGLFSERLLALGKFAREQGIEFCTEIISGDNASKIEKFLLQVNGIGPKVLSNYFSLRGIQKHEQHAFVFNPAGGFMKRQRCRATILFRPTGFYFTLF